MSHIEREAAKDLSTPYILNIDEAERLFKNPLGKKVSIDFYRRGRKFKMSINCITQNHKDFLLDPEVADAILPNTTHVFILRQKKIDWESLQSTFGLTGAEIEAIRSLKKVQGKYSELFYMQDENRAILRIIPDPLSYWISTSDSSDKEKIRILTEANPNMPKIEIFKKLAYESNAA